MVADDDLDAHDDVHVNSVVHRFHVADFVVVGCEGCLFVVEDGDDFQEHVFGLIEYLRNIIKHYL